MLASCNTLLHPRMQQHPMSNTVGRRSFIKTLSVASSIAACSTTSSTLLAAGADANKPQGPNTESTTRTERMRWWHEDKFGMFIHWGLYSLIGRQEWTLEMEGIPLSQYEQLAKHFNPRPGAAKEWAKLAKKAGQKYMVMTSKHHEG